MSQQTEAETQQKFVQTGKFYTAARNFKELLGVFPDGTPIPGGPYTITQFLTAAAVLAVGFITRPLWSSDPLTSTLFIVAIAAAVGYFVGRMPHSRRSIINALACSVSLILHPRTGRYRGKGVEAVFSPAKLKNAKKAKEQAEKRSTADHRTDHAVEKGDRDTGIRSGLDRLMADVAAA